MTSRSVCLVYRWMKVIHEMKHAKVHDFQNLGGIDMSSLQASDMTMPEEHTHIRQDCSNIFCCGYGKVGTYVMEDPDLHLIAKAIYAYLCAYGDTNFLGREQICYDLKINKNTYNGGLFDGCGSGRYPWRNRCCSVFCLSFYKEIQRGRAPEVRGGYDGIH